MAKRIAIFATFLTLVSAQHDPHFTQNRTTIVQLFEWRWNDIAEECERFLGPYGYGGVQTSPPTENAIINDGHMTRPWWERYQPVSYKLETRSGNEEEFKSMVRRCNNVGVRVYIDAVINHMSGGFGPGTGTGGSNFDGVSLDYPAVPFSSSDFNVQGQCASKTGEIENYQDVNQVRNCRLSGLNDLNQGNDNVRGKLIEYLNRLISYGVAGFRVDASKHMWPGDLQAIFGTLNDLNAEHGFPSGARAFIYQEVQVDENGSEAVTPGEYTSIGRVTEFNACANIGYVLRRRNQQLKYLKNWGEGWAFLSDGNAFVFVDNHDNQRSHGIGGANLLTFRDSKLYKMAQAFFLAWPYGITRVMSSYYWYQNFQGGEDMNDWVGPPHDINMNILPVTINPDITCGNGWNCEHRWREIFNMVQFRNVAKGTGMNDWWDNDKDQIAFSRGDRGFIAINNDDYPLQTTIKTGLSPGRYCDVISGNFVNGQCSGKVITVNNDGTVSLNINNADDDPVVAIHANEKI